MNYTDDDIKAIVDTKTEQLLREIKLKDEEYNILKVTSEQLEAEQQRQIYELQQKIQKTLEALKDPFENEDGDASWYEIADTYKEQIEKARKELNGEE